MAPPRPGNPTGGSDEERCQSCLTGFAVLPSDNTCAIDSDNDGAADAVDIDDDNDGLIEISNLDMLYNIRWNLDGTTYDDESDDGDGNEGDTTGAPVNQTNTNNCETPTDGFYLCGYELTRSLDFAVAGDYANGTVNDSWRPTDDSDPAMVVDPADGTNSGWAGIGSFNAIFDGNGNTISNLYRRVNGDNGLFTSTQSNAHIRSIGIVSGSLYGGSGRDTIGMLVGNNRGDITDSYATTVVIDANDGGSSASSTQQIGGLAGANSGTIRGSYATGAVEGGNNFDSIGGLVGRNSSSGAIIASYATATVTGNRNRDYAGGLVGRNDGGRIIASYATGDVSVLSINPSGAAHGGGLVGINSGAIIGSYATGAVTHGSGDNGEVGGLVGQTSTGSTITASYATGNVNGGAGRSDLVGGLIAWFRLGTLVASYSIGDANAGSGANDRGGRLVGANNQSHSENYGFGSVSGQESTYNEQRPDGFTATSAAVLQINDNSESGLATYAGATWDSADSNTLNAWDFGSNTQNPALRYADYDGDGVTGVTYDCDMYPATIPGTTTPIVCNETLLPGQR